VALDSLQFMSTGGAIVSLGVSGWVVATALVRALWGKAW
jgi:hypothetical protein